MTETRAVRRGYLECSVGQVHYREAGSGDPPVVLLHQSPASSRMFERAYPLFAARSMRAVGVDTPGFGMSDVPDHPPSISEYADWIAEAIAALSDRPVRLAGHHTGAAIAAELVVRHPRAAGALVLSGPPMYSEERRASYPGRPPEGVEPRPDGSHLAELFARRVEHTPGWSDLEAMHRSVVDTLLNGDTAWYGHRAVYDHDLEPAIKAIAVPTLVLSNTGDEVHGDSLRVHERRPDFELALLEGGTHDVVDELTGEWVDAVASFFERAG